MESLSLFSWRKESVLHQWGCPLDHMMSASRLWVVICGKVTEVHCWEVLSHQGVLLGGPQSLRYTVGMCLGHLAFAAGRNF